MARGRDAHEARRQAVAALGKHLSRRARSRCELCEATGPLSVIEVAGNPEPEPDPSWALLLCGRCVPLATEAARVPPDARFLQTAVWSETQPVQVTAVRLLRAARADGVAWADETLDGLYLSPEVQAVLGDA